MAKKKRRLKMYLPIVRNTTGKFPGYEYIPENIKKNKIIRNENFKQR